MKCKDGCWMWVKRPLPKKPKEFYPVGRCLNMRFNDARQSMSTTGDTNCRYGEMDR